MVAEEQMTAQDQAGEEQVIIVEEAYNDSLSDETAAYVEASNGSEA